MNLETTDPDLAAKIKHDLDFYEIRDPDEIAIIHNWIGRALVTESMLSLLRKGMIDIVKVGLAPKTIIDNENNVINYDDIEPMFTQNYTLKQ